MKFLISTCAGLAFSFGACLTGAHAAETLEMAVTEIAQKYISAQSKQGEATRRVAVTAFIMPDRRTTTFTNLSMIALTGKMVELANNVTDGREPLQVIERAQLETALRNIDIEGVPIFDESTASKLGQFLGVDTLIVGEITPMRDLVRIDSRMIDISTMVTIEQAKSTVPLTPSVQEHLNADIIMNSAFVQTGDGPDPRSGIWNGTAQCGDYVVGVALAMMFPGNNTVTAMQTYYPVANSPKNAESGSLEMEGTVDPATGTVALNGAGWLHQPRGHGSIPIKGVFDLDRRTFDGAYDTEACSISKVALRKMTR
ncbi:MAG: hypothetical protein AAGJ09_01540 [Pseudomonadota bacterium]